jgi:hypothetical protein
MSLGRYRPIGGGVRVVTVVATLIGGLEFQTRGAIFAFELTRAPIPCYSNRYKCSRMQEKSSSSRRDKAEA